MPGTDEPTPITAWIARQRWFANPAADPALEVLGSLPLTEDGRVRKLLVEDATGGAEALYQVLLTSMRGQAMTYALQEERPDERFLQHWQAILEAVVTPTPRR